ncbi:MAG: hypothetical protein ACLGI2_10380 [Acidimicrobiia bacterium]
MSAPTAETLQSRLEAAGDDAAPEVTIRSGRPSITDPVALLRHLEASGRFQRDSLIGRIFHPGRVSLRENQPNDSLHVVVRGNHIAAHVDRVSPLGSGEPGYSLRRAVAHNLAGAAHDFVLLVRGRQGDHRCELDCQWEWDGDAHAGAEDLLDPATTAWSVQIEVRVAATLDEVRLRRAFATVFAGRMARDDPLRCIDCPDAEALVAARTELQRSPAAMDDCPPLRAVLAKHPHGDYLLLSVNHAAADGVAAIDMLRAVARAYAGRDGGGAEGNGSGRPPMTFLAAEDLPVHPAAPPVLAVVAGARDAVERLRNWLARPARLAPEGATAETGYGFHGIRLSADDTRRAINRYRASTSRNVLVASLHLAIADWNRRHGSLPRGRVGVLVPVNLRPLDWPAETLANCTINARISTSRRHRANRTAALGAVRAQHTRSKRTRTGIALLAALERSGLLPLWAKQSRVVLQPIVRNRYVDTAMLAYMGWMHEPPSFGDDAGETVEVWYSAPPRTPSCLSIGAVVVAGCLHVVFRYPHMLFGPEAIRSFADCYVAALRVVSEGRS